MKQILIVEDDLAFGTMLQTWLKKKGFDVEKVTNVGAAARWLTEGGADSVNLILSDLRLPTTMASSCSPGCVSAILRCPSS